MAASVRVAIVAAVAENGVIGRDGRLPWRLRSDLRHFRELTMGKPVVMGRKTYESIGRALPGRTNIVISGQPDFGPEGAVVLPDLRTAIEQARVLAQEAGVGEAVVIGGAGVYGDALAIADRIYLTEVHALVDGDVWFPEIDRGTWREISRNARQAGPSDDYDHSFVVLQRELAGEPK